MNNHTMMLSHHHRLAVVVRIIHWLLVAAVIALGTFGLVALSVGESHATIHTPHLSVNRHAVVQRSTLPHCAYEDGSGSDLPCTWNIGPGRDGNGRGLAYWVGHDLRPHYVWRGDPTMNHPQRSWVGKAAAYVLTTYNNPDRDWHRCWLAPHGDVAKVGCPNGQRIWL